MTERIRVAQNGQLLESKPKFLINSIAQFLQMRVRNRNFQSDKFALLHNCTIISEASREEYKNAVNNTYDSEMSIMKTIISLLRCMARNITIVSCQPENTILSVDKDKRLDHGTEGPSFQTLRDLVVELGHYLDTNANHAPDTISLALAQRGNLRGPRFTSRTRRAKNGSRCRLALH